MKILRIIFFFNVKCLLCLKEFLKTHIYRCTWKCYKSVLYQKKNENYNKKKQISNLFLCFYILATAPTFSPVVNTISRLPMLQPPLANTTRLQPPLVSTVQSSVTQSQVAPPRTLSTGLVLMSHTAKVGTFLILCYSKILFHIYC